MGCLCRFQVYLFVLTATTAFGNPITATNKLSLATWDSYYQQDHMGPGTYAFGFDIEDPVTGNIQFKQEERHLNGTITGSYGYVDSDGRPNVVTYISDGLGYRAKLEVEGEPVRYFPDEPTFLGNSLQQQPTDTDGSATADNYLDNGNDAGVPLRRVLFHFLPTDFPSYHKYITATGVLK